MKMASNNKAACILFALRRQADDKQTMMKEPYWESEEELCFAGSKERSDLLC